MLCIISLAVVSPSDPCNPISCIPRYSNSYCSFLISIQLSVMEDMFVSQYQSDHTFLIIVKGILCLTVSTCREPTDTFIVDTQPWPIVGCD